MTSARCLKCTMTFGITSDLWRLPKETCWTRCHCGLRHSASGMSPTEEIPTNWVQVTVEQAEADRMGLEIT
jgi:hypothetical protein